MDSSQDDGQKLLQCLEKDLCYDLVANLVNSNASGCSDKLEQFHQLGPSVEGDIYNDITSHEDKPTLSPRNPIYCSQLGHRGTATTQGAQPLSSGLLSSSTTGLGVDHFEYDTTANSTPLMNSFANLQMAISACGSFQNLADVRTQQMPNNSSVPCSLPRNANSSMLVTDVAKIKEFITQVTEKPHGNSVGMSKSLSVPTMPYFDQTDDWLRSIAEGLVRDQPPCRDSVSSMNDLSPSRSSQLFQDHMSSYKSLRSDHTASRQRIASRVSSELNLRELLQRAPDGSAEPLLHMPIPESSTAPQSTGTLNNMNKVNQMINQQQRILPALCHRPGCMRQSPHAQQDAVCTCGADQVTLLNAMNIAKMADREDGDELFQSRPTVGPVDPSLLNPAVIGQAVHPSLPGFPPTTGLSRSAIAGFHPSCSSGVPSGYPFHISPPRAESIQANPRLLMQPDGALQQVLYPRSSRMGENSGDCYSMAALSRSSLMGANKTASQSFPDLLEMTRQCQLAASQAYPVRRHWSPDPGTSNEVSVGITDLRPTVHGRVHKETTVGRKSWPRPGDLSNDNSGFGGSRHAGDSREDHHSLPRATAREYQKRKNHRGGIGEGSDVPLPPNASKLLVDFRMNSLQIHSLYDLSTHLIEFAQDQLGSRFIQRQLELEPPEVVAHFIDELIMSGKTLMCDVFGNYVIQKCLECGSQEQQEAIVLQMKNNVRQLSLQMCGCRVVQQALECCPLRLQVMIVSELKGHVLSLVEDQNGNHVMQKVIEQVPCSEIGFVLDAFRGNVPLMASHCYGCRVIQRLLEKFPAEQTMFIVEELYCNLENLLKDQYGNYVMQHILIYGADKHREYIQRLVQRRLEELSRHKFASNVVEKCFLPHNNNIICQEMLDEVMKGEKCVNPPILSLVQDKYANYVVQRMIDVVRPVQKERLCSILRSELPVLRKLPFGRHIAAKVSTLINSDTVIN